MKAQEHTEEVLRAIHVLFSKAAPYAGSKFKVVVDKEKMMALLKELNSCMYDMMEEYELTSSGREKAEREAQRIGDEKIFDARKKAEDIYAASIMYSDHALDEIRDIMEESARQIEKIQDDLKNKIRENERAVRDNQSELKSQLNTLIDTQKYLRLIEEENIRREKENETSEAPSHSSGKSKIVPEIRINEDYFIQTGQKIETDSETEADLQMAAEEAAKLDEEYFSWKEKEIADAAEKVSVERKKSFSLFGKKEED